MDAGPTAAEPYWLTATRTSYDDLAEPYTEELRDLMARQPYDRAVLRLFADLVQDGGGGPVLDVGCGPGRVTAHLVAAGLDANGVDLSPGMVAVARREHPGLRFDVGSMTALDVPAASLGGLVAWYSVIHVPDDVLPDVLDGFARALRPGGVVVLAFQTGDEVVHRTVSRLGPAVDLRFHRRTAEQVGALLVAAGLDLLWTCQRPPVERDGETTGQCYLLAARPGTAPVD